MFKGRGYEDLIHYILLGIAFYFSFTFAKDMIPGFMVILLIFEVMKPTLMNQGLTEIKSMKGKLFVGLASIFIILSLLATSSVLINNYSKIIDGSKTNIVTDEYKNNKKLEEQVNKKIENIQKEIDSYPSLETFTKDIPSEHSTNLTKLTETWQQGKGELNNRLETANKELESTLERYNNIEQYTETSTNVEYKSYTKLFELIAEKTGIATTSITMIIFLLISVLLEIGIVVTKGIAVKARKIRLGQYEKTFVEQFKDYQDELAKENFNFMINKLKEVKNDTYQIEQKKSLEPVTASPSKQKIFKMKVRKKPHKNKINNIHKDIVPENAEIEQENNVIDFKIQEAKSLPAKPFESKELDEENIKRYFNYIKWNCTGDGVAPGYKKVADSLKIGQGEALRIFKELKDRGVLETDKRQTRIVKMDMEG